MPGNILIDPVDFMSKNIVVPHHGPIGTTQQESGIKTLCLVQSAQSGRQLGAEVPKFVLHRYRGQANAAAVFTAFWCPYAQNQTLTCELNNGASLCFTATMDGCTLGVQPGGGQGLCTVAHSNEGSFGAAREDTFGMDGARQFQGDEQMQRINAAIGDGATTISPADYMSDHDGARVLKSTTFGVRVGGGWQFYTQKYLVQGGTYFLRGLQRQV